MNYLQNPRGTGPRIGDIIKASCSGSVDGVDYDAEIEGVVIDTDPLTIDEPGPYKGTAIARRVDDVIEVVGRFDE